MDTNTQVTPLADYIIYVIDVAGGDKVPRKGGRIIITIFGCMRKS